MRELEGVTEATVVAEIAAGRAPSLTRLRQRRRRRDALLTRDQVFAAHKLYWDGGYSMPDLGLRLSMSERVLRVAFTRHGLRIRSASAATALRFKDSSCVGCGCDLDARSTGCSVCISRHHYRKRRAKVPA